MPRKAAKLKPVKRIKKKLYLFRAEKKKEDYSFVKIISTRLFGRFVDENMSYFSSLKASFDSAGLDMMFRTYLSFMFLIASLSYIVSFLATIIALALLRANLLYSVLGLLIFPTLIGVLVFLYTYSYPQIRSSKRKTSIETNLPFAINHMAAVAESGATPYSMFKVLAQFKEYGQISYEAERIVRNVDVFGLDETAAIKETIINTPSQALKRFLEGILTTIQTGGNLKRYLKENSKDAMFNYRLNRQKYTEMISIYADFYTALLIAAPLILIAILAVLNNIGGSIFGLPIDFVIKLGVFGLMPIMNIIFLAFLEITQPAM